MALFPYQLETMSSFPNRQNRLRERSRLGQSYHKTVPLTHRPWQNPASLRITRRQIRLDEASRKGTDRDAKIPRG